MVCIFITDDDIYKYISKMGNNLIPCSIAIGKENIYFFTPHFKVVKRERIDNDKFSNTNGRSVDPFDYHDSNCEKNSFENYEYTQFIQIITIMLFVYLYI